MDTTVRMTESEVEASYGHNNMDDRERSGSQDTTVRMAESEVEASYGHSSTSGRERGGSQKVIMTC